MNLTLEPSNAKSLLSWNCLASVLMVAAEGWAKLVGTRELRALLDLEKQNISAVVNPKCLTGAMF